MNAFLDSLEEGREKSPSSAREKPRANAFLDSLSEDSNKGAFAALPEGTTYHDGDSRNLPGGGTNRYAGYKATEVANPHKGTGDQIGGREAQSVVQGLMGAGGSERVAGKEYHGRTLVEGRTAGGQDAASEMIGSGWAQRDRTSGNYAQTQADVAAVADFGTLGSRGGSTLPGNQFRRDHNDDIRASSLDAMRYGTASNNGTVVNEIGKGINRGAHFLKSATGGLIEMAGDAVGSKGMQDYGQETSRSADKYNDMYAPAAVGTTDQIHGAKDAVKWAAGKIGEVIPQILPAAVGMLIPGGAAAEAAIATRLGAAGLEAASAASKAKSIVSMGKGMIPNAPNLIGENAASAAHMYNDKTGEYEDNLKGHLLQTAATGFGAALLDTASLHGITKGLGKIATDATGTAVAKGLGRAALATQMEGVTEAGQKVLEEANLNSINKDHAFAPKGWWNMVKEDYFGGMVGGAAMHGIGEAGHAVYNAMKSEDQQTIDSPERQARGAGNTKYDSPAARAATRILVTEGNQINVRGGTNFHGPIVGPLEGTQVLDGNVKTTVVYGPHDEGDDAANARAIAKQLMPSFEAKLAGTPMGKAFGLAATKATEGEVPQSADDFKQAIVATALEHMGAFKKKDTQSFGDVVGSILNGSIPTKSIPWDIGGELHDQPQGPTSATAELSRSLMNLADYGTTTKDPVTGLPILAADAVKPFVQTIGRVLDAEPGEAQDAALLSLMEPFKGNKPAVMAVQAAYKRLRTPMGDEQVEADVPGPTIAEKQRDEFYDEESDQTDSSLLAGDEYNGGSSLAQAEHEGRFRVSGIGTINSQQARNAEPDKNGVYGTTERVISDSPIKDSGRASTMASPQVDEDGRSFYDIRDTRGEDGHKIRFAHPTDNTTEKGNIDVGRSKEDNSDNHYAKHDNTSYYYPQQMGDNGEWGVHAQLAKDHPGQDVVEVRDNGEVKGHVAVRPEVESDRWDNMIKAGAYTSNAIGSTGMSENREALAGAGIVYPKEAENKLTFYRNNTGDSSPWVMDPMHVIKMGKKMRAVESGKGEPDAKQGIYEDVSAALTAISHIASAEDHNGEAKYHMGWAREERRDAEGPGPQVVNMLPDSLILVPKGLGDAPLTVGDLRADSTKYAVQARYQDELAKFTKKHRLQDFEPMPHATYVQSMDAGWQNANLTKEKAEELALQTDYRDSVLDVFTPLKGFEGPMNPEAFQGWSRARGLFLEGAGLGTEKDNKGGWSKRDPKLSVRDNEDNLNEAYKNEMVKQEAPPLAYGTPGVSVDGKHDDNGENPYHGDAGPGTKSDAPSVLPNSLSAEAMSEVHANKAKNLANKGVNTDEQKPTQSKSKQGATANATPGLRQEFETVYADGSTTAFVSDPTSKLATEYKSAINADGNPIGIGRKAHSGLEKGVTQLGSRDSPLGNPKKIKNRVAVESIPTLDGTQKPELMKIGVPYKGTMPEALRVNHAEGPKAVRELRKQLRSSSIEDLRAMLIEANPKAKGSTTDKELVEKVIQAIMSKKTDALRTEMYERVFSGVPQGSGILAATHNEDGGYLPSDEELSARPEGASTKAAAKSDTSTDSASGEVTLNQNGGGRDSAVKDRMDYNKTMMAVGVRPITYNLDPDSVLEAKADRDAQDKTNGHEGKPTDWVPHLVKRGSLGATYLKDGVLALGNEADIPEESVVASNATVAENEGLSAAPEVVLPDEAKDKAEAESKNLEVLGDWLVRHKASDEFIKNIDSFKKRNPIWDMYESFIKRGSISDYLALGVTNTGNATIGKSSGVYYDGVVYYDSEGLRDNPDKSEFTRILLHEFGHAIDGVNNAVSREWDKKFPKEVVDVRGFMHGTDAPATSDAWKTPNELLAEFNAMRHLIPSITKDLAPGLQSMLESEAAKGVEAKGVEAKVYSWSKKTGAKGYNVDLSNSTVTGIKAAYAAGKTGDKAANRELLFNLYRDYLAANPGLLADIQKGADENGGKLIDTGAGNLTGKGALGHSQIFASILTQMAKGTPVAQASYSGMSDEDAKAFEDMMAEQRDEELSNEELSNEELSNEDQRAEDKAHADAIESTKRSKEAKKSARAIREAYKAWAEAEGAEKTDALTTALQMKEVHNKLYPEDLYETVADKDAKTNKEKRDAQTEANGIAREAAAEQETKDEAAGIKKVGSKAIADMIPGLHKLYPGFSFSQEQTKGTDRAKISGGHVTLYSNNLDYESDVLDAIEHEVTGHGAMRFALSKEGKFDSVMKRILESSDLKDIRAKIEGQGYEGKDHAEEMAASMAEDARKLRGEGYEAPTLADAIKNVENNPTEAHVYDLLNAARQTVVSQYYGGSYASAGVAENFVQGMTNLGTSIGNRAARTKYLKSVISAVEGGVDFTSNLLSPMTKSLADRALAMKSKGDVMADFMSRFVHQIGEKGHAIGADGKVLDDVTDNVEARDRMTLYNGLMEFANKLPKQKGLMDRVMSKSNREYNKVLQADMEAAFEASVKKSDAGLSDQAKQIYDALADHLPGFYDTVRAMYPTLRVDTTDGQGKVTEGGFPSTAPIYLDHEKWIAGHDKIVKKLVDDGRMTKKDAEKLWSDKAASNSLVEVDIINPMTSSFNHNFIPEGARESLMDYYDKNILQNLQNFVHSATKRGSLDKQMGNWVTGDDGVERFDATFFARQAADSLSPADRATFNSKIMPALLGTLGSKMSDELRSTNSWATVFLNTTLLPLSLLSQFVDLGGMAIRDEHVGRVITHIGKLMFNKKFRNDMIAEAEKALPSLHRQVGEMMASSGLGNYNSKAANINNMFFRMNGMQKWSEVSRILAYTMFKSAATRYAKQAVSKNAGERQRGQQDLAELNLTVDEVNAWNEGGQVMDAKFNVAANKWVDGAVIKPGAPIRPIYHSDASKALLAYLHSYTNYAHETFGKRIAYNVERRTGGARLMPIAIAAGTMIPLVMAGASLRAAISNAGGDDDEDKKKRDYLGSLIRTGLLGAGAQTAYDLYSAQDHGGSMLASLTVPTSVLEQMLKTVYVNENGLPELDEQEAIAKNMPILNKSKQFRDLIGKEQRK